jgi:hypothetical protein
MLKWFSKTIGFQSSQGTMKKEMERTKEPGDGAKRKIRAAWRDPSTRIETSPETNR